VDHVDVSLFVGPADGRHLIGVVAGVEVTAGGEQQIDHGAVVRDRGEMQGGAALVAGLGELRHLRQERPGTLDGALTNSSEEGDDIRHRGRSSRDGCGHGRGQQPDEE
jgi:hypothetical protein